MAGKMSKKEALELVGGVIGNAELNSDTLYGGYWQQPCTNGFVDYQFDADEEQEDASDYPWDVEHVVRIKDEDMGVLWESILH